MGKNRPETGILTTKNTQVARYAEKTFPADLKNSIDQRFPRYGSQFWLIIVNSNATRLSTRRAANILTYFEQESFHANRRRNEANRSLAENSTNAKPPGDRNDSACSRHASCILPWHAYSHTTL